MSRTIPVLVLIAVAAGCQEQTRSAAPAERAKAQQGAIAAGEKKPAQYEKYAPPALQREIEQKVLLRLSQGRQSAAEHLLADHVKAIPEIERLMSLNDEKERADALALVKRHADAYRANQRLIFLHAALMRSRFEVEEAFPYFVVAAMADEKTLVGQSAFRIIGLDNMEEIRRNPDKVFADLEQMVASFPDEIIVRWMLAVECRTYNHNKQGVVHYKKILDKWKPGPVLVHQTYGNLLDELKRFDEALVERRKAVELEPRGWSYEGLGNTLDSLRRFDEANNAFAKACDLDPKDGHYLGNWAGNAMLRKKYDEAIRKCERAVQLDPTYPHTWFVWAECLEAQGKKSEALQKYREILKSFPNIIGVKLQMARLEAALGKERHEKKP